MPKNKPEEEPMTPAIQESPGPAPDRLAAELLDQAYKQLPLATTTSIVISILALK